MTQTEHTAGNKPDTKVRANDYCPNTMMLVGAALAGAPGKGIKRLAKHLCAKPAAQEERCEKTC